MTDRSDAGEPAPTVRSLARDLVAIPSHEDASDAGDRIADWLADETDATVERDAVGNVLAFRGPEPSAVDAGPDLALVGHHDVVPPADEQVRDGAYVVEEHDGRLYGRGAADMKGALAAGLCAFRDAAVSDRRVAFASFVGEERGGIGASHAIEEGFVPDRAVVMEGSTGYSESGVTDVAVAHRGRREIEIEASGRAAHASNPDAGDNAIHRACAAIDRLRSIDPPRTTAYRHELRGLITPTGIAGGDAPNVIPDRCTVTVDERTIPDGRIDLDEALADLDTAAGSGIDWTIESDTPPMVCDDRGFAERALMSARSVQGAGGFVVKPHATDAGRLAAAGTDPVVVGPSEPGEAHTDEESVSLDVLDRCYRIYRRVLDGVDLSGPG